MTGPTSLLPGLLVQSPRPATPGSAALSITTPSATSGPAPLGLFLAAEATGFPVSAPWKDLRYRWTFSDAGDWDKLDAAFLPGASRNVAYGPHTAHAFAAPGTYTVTCEVTDGTTTVSDTLTVTVESDADHFAASDIHVVSNQSDFTGAPAGATQHATFESAFLAARNTGGPAAILLRAGETFAETGTYVFNDTSYDGPIKLGRFGSGARPEFDMASADMLIRVQEFSSAFVFDGVRFTGGYDAATGLGDTLGSLSLTTNTGPMIFHDCAFDGLSVSIYPIATQPDLIVASSIITNWSNYGMLFPNADRIGLVGNYIYQKPDASFGPGGKDPAPDGRLWSNHGPMRFTGCNDSVTVVRQNHLFSNSGWTNSFTEAGAQECFRWGTEDAENAILVAERNMMENGYRICQIGPNSGVAVGGPAGILFEKNVLLAHGQTGSIIEHGYDNSVYRNNIAIRTGYAKGLNSPKFLTGLNGVDVTTNPVIVRNNSFVSLDDVTAMSEGDLNPTLTLSAVDNLIYAPNASEPEGLDNAPLDIAPSAFPSLYEGLRWETVLDAGYAPTGLTWATFRPLDGSGALGAATADAPLDDFLGNLRGASSAAGAFATSGGAGTVLQAVVDQVGLTAGDAATVDVTANDLDPVGGGLTVTAVDTAGVLGSVTDNGDGTLTYDTGTAFDTLAEGETLTDVVGYTITDNDGATQGAELRVTVTGGAGGPLDFSGMTATATWDAGVQYSELDGVNAFTVQFIADLTSGTGVLISAGDWRNNGMAAIVRTSTGDFEFRVGDLRGASGQIIFTPPAGPQLYTLIADRNAPDGVVMRVYGGGTLLGSHSAATPAFNDPVIASGFGGWVDTNDGTRVDLSTFTAGETDWTGPANTMTIYADQVPAIA